MTNLQLDIEISDLKASAADPARLELLLELQERRSWWVARLSEAVSSRLTGPSVAGWCLIICAVTFVLGAVSAAAMPSRTTPSLLAGVSIFFLALGLLLRPSGFSGDRQVPGGNE